ncbi:ParB/RepB/Spo0J family partition protein [Ruegeria atlantica]|uniref:ParB/RepB/Spo0J family partition protein n=1 Tax=Ruegeria atlantica TaxID=81569 RepID=UPI001580EE1B|nr:ParB N-terminal domain-containing protein [Ruegeria atlantica]
MTTTTKFEMIQVPLGRLVPHPENVRTGSETAYTETSIAALAANIREVGLLQPLLVKATDKKSYGVLAGGRRLSTSGKCCPR